VKKELKNLESLLAHTKTTTQIGAAMFGKCGVRTEKGPEETIISYNGGKKERNYKLMSQLVQEVKLKDSTYSLTSLVSMELH